jgi:transposase
MPFAQGPCDRQTAAAVRVRIDWTSALGLELADPGFDSRVWCAFRARLVQGSAGEAEPQLLDVRLEACTARGLLKARGRQRTDATQVLGAWRVRSRTRRVAETRRAALTALARAAPDGLQERVPLAWDARYGRRSEELRRPRAQTDREVYARQGGADEAWLLAQGALPDPPAALNTLREVALRRRWPPEYALNARGPDE